MAGSSLLLLIDDIASVLADVAVMTKVAAKKTAGVLGDDLALNAQQIAGIAADRELPVVWAVSKGSLRNKVILVPLALVISTFVPWLVMPLLMLGGLFLCFEGVEKLAHRFLHGKQGEDQHHAELLQAVADPTVDLVAFENERIQGAIRTDFILSAEIVVITLGTIADAGFAKQVAVLCTIALAMTVGVYGLVAAIIKLDDVGYYLHAKRDAGQVLQRKLGALILRAAPALMKTLSVVGTAAMFMVGGAILVHGMEAVQHFVEHASESIAVGSPWMVTLATVLLESLVGILAGALALSLYSGGKRLLGRSEAARP